MDRIVFRGHPLISALHPTTIEITTDTHLTRRGDCIVGVGSERGCSGLDPTLKAGLKRATSTVNFRFIVGSESFAVCARGDPRLTLQHPHDMVIRKSDYISDRTVGVKADAAAKDFPRSMISMLRNPDAVGYLEVDVT